MPCAVCGDGKANHSMSGVLLCGGCAREVTAQRDAQRSRGQPANVAGIARRLYRRRMGTLAQYSLRDIPGDLWLRAKRRALEEDSDLRQIILSALDAYLAEGGKS